MRKLNVECCAEKIKKMMMTHSELVERAYHFVMHSGIRIDKGTYTMDYKASFALKEFQTIVSEVPDVWGFIATLQSSVVIECKTSRNDYLAGLKKAHRRRPQYGMGKYRLYFTPPGLLDPEEIPVNFGLLECHKTMVKTVKLPNAFSEYNWIAEQSMMASALRRIEKRGLLDTVYEHINTQYKIEKISG